MTSAVTNLVDSYRDIMDNQSGEFDVLIISYKNLLQILLLLYTFFNNCKSVGLLC